MNRSEITQMAYKLLTDHGLIGKGWKFEWDNGKRRAGACHYATKTISGSQHILPAASDEEVLETLLHEIAHALTPGHNHDGVWRKQLRDMGGTGARTHRMETVEGRYDLMCESCGKIGNRHAQSPAMRAGHLVHRVCGGSRVWVQDRHASRATRPTAVMIPIAASTPKTRPATPAAKSETLCKCGCFAPTKGGSFLPGHDAKLLSVLRMDVSLAWGAHVGRTAEAAEAAEGDILTSLRAFENPAFKQALRDAFAKIPAENTKLSAKFSAWVESHANWADYLEAQQRNGN